jgi:hypothetical protein
MKDEVKDIYKELLLKIKEGKKLTCEGNRCKYCFMQDFCKDLNLLINKKALESKNVPMCLTDKREKQKKLKIEFTKDLDPFTFLEFFIKNRYFVKGSACSKCIHGENCDGAWIEEVRKDSFGILKAILK